MLDTLTFDQVVEGLDNEDLMCEDTSAKHSDPRKAEWYTFHEGCGYYICTECKIADVKAIAETVANGLILYCGNCGAEGIPPNTVKFVLL